MSFTNLERARVFKRGASKSRADSIGNSRVIFDDLSTWPPEVIEFLENHHDRFLGREQSLIGQTPIIPWSPEAYDRALLGLRSLLNPYTLRGYHCTRLTETEIEHVISTGMQPPNSTILQGRIQALEDAGLIERRVADRLRAENLAHQKNRAGKIWFCFFPPQLGGQSGIERFFRFWGGEALYGLHELDSETGTVLRSIGTPCIVEADVPMASLAIHSYLDTHVARQFLVNRGFKTGEHAEHEDRAEQEIPAANIRRIVRHPERDFCNLTDCLSWKVPLK
jgi:hypothetical protein